MVAQPSSTGCCVSGPPSRLFNVERLRLEVVFRKETKSWAHVRKHQARSMLDTILVATAVAIVANNPIDDSFPKNLPVSVLVILSTCVSYMPLFCCGASEV